MKKIIHDERSLEQKRIIESELYIFILAILALSSIVKFYFMNAGASSIIVEGICFVFAGLYYIGRSFTLGHSFYSKHFDIKTMLIYSLASTGLCFILAGYNTVWDFTRVFLIIFGTSFVFNSILYLLNKNKQKRLDIEIGLDDE